MTLDSMYAITLTYTAPLDQIDQALPEHVDWLEKHYSTGLFLASGRQEPRTGGMILARDTDPAQITRVIATDPFAARHLARHTVVRFHPSRLSEELHSVHGLFV